MRPEYNPGALSSSQAEGIMIRRPSLALLIIVSGAFFLLGLYSVFVQAGQSPSGSSTPGVPSALEATSTAVVSGQQTTLLILGWIP